MRKKFIDLNIKDAFMFPAVVADPEICRPLLEVMLGIKIERIEVCGEYELAYHSDYKKVRLDVYAADENNTHFNIEMQVQPKDNLPRRMRYYGSQMDMELLEFLKYVESPSDKKVLECKSSIVHQVHKKVQEIKRSRSEENRYMLLGELIDDERDDAKAEGKAEGHVEMLKLISAMLADGKMDDVPRLEEKKFFDKMCARYHISIDDSQ